LGVAGWVTIVAILAGLGPGQILVGSMAEDVAATVGSVEGASTQCPPPSGWGRSTAPCVQSLLGVDYSPDEPLDDREVPIASSG